MELRFYLAGEKAGPLFKRSTARNAELVRAAVRGAAADAKETIEKRGRADISKAGRFGSRWTDGFTVSVTEGGGKVRVEAKEAVPYWTVFQYGAVIHGKPLLWIPLSFAADAQGVRARDYPGALFRVNRKDGKAPLLMTPGSPAQPKYFGKEFVTIPKKFHLLEIIRDVAKNFKSLYASKMKGK